jgi:hypothetical protein
MAVIPGGGGFHCRAYEDASECMRGFNHDRREGDKSNTA